MAEPGNVDDIADVGSGLDTAGCGYVLLIFFTGALGIGVGGIIIFL